MSRFQIEGKKRCMNQSGKKCLSDFWGVGGTKMTPKNWICDGIACQKRPKKIEHHLSMFPSLDLLRILNQN